MAWLLLMVVGLATLEQCSSSSLCDSSVERGIISTSSGTVLVDTSLRIPVDPVCIRCGYQDQLYTNPAIVTYYYNGAVIVNDTVSDFWIINEGLIIQNVDQIIVSPNEMLKSNFFDSSIDSATGGPQQSFIVCNDTVSTVTDITLTLSCTPIYTATEDIAGHLVVLAAVVFIIFFYGALWHQMKSFHPENSAIDDDCDKSILSFVNTATVHETILHGGQYSTIEFDQKGLFYHSEEHGVSVIIPENAVKGPATMQFTASRLWPNFKCANRSYETVSPFVYIHTDDELSEPAQVHIPHYIDGDDKAENVELLVQGHKKPCVFEVRKDVKVQVNQTTACVEMKHFCVLCLAAARAGRPKRRRYQVLSAEKTTQHTKEVQICILYSKACFQRTRKHFTEKGYTIKTSKEKKGTICQEGISISDVQIADGRWTCTEMGTINEKITEKDIDLFKFLDCTPETVTDEDEKTLEAYEDEGQYPPRFHLRFENTTHEATNKSCPVTITLTGFVPDSDSDPAADSFSPNISITTDLEETFSNSGENYEEKDPFLIELMPYIEPILYDNIQTYYQFGAQLGLTIDQLTQLEDNFPDKGRRIMQMLLKWRDSSQSVSHHKISKALHTCGYPILSVIVENRFFYECKTGGDYEVVDKGRQLNGYQIIAEKLQSIDTGDSDLLQQKPSDADFNRLVMHSIASKWELFAQQVGLDGNAVEAIEKDNNGICLDCFIAVLDNWKRRKSPPFTWDTVLSVLYSDTVRGYKAGEQVYQHLMHITVYRPADPA